MKEKDIVKNYTYYWGTNHYAKAYKFEVDSIAAVITTPVNPQYCLTAGPPFIPVIPNPFLFPHKKESYYFFVDMQLSTKYDNHLFNLNDIQFKLGKQSIRIPDSILLISKNRFGMPPNAPNNDQFDLTKNLTATTNSQINLTDSSQTIRFLFCQTSSQKIKHLEIYFPSARSQIIKMHKKRRILYTAAWVN